MYKIDSNQPNVSDSSEQRINKNECDDRSDISGKTSLDRSTSLINVGSKQNMNALEKNNGKQNASNSESKKSSSGKVKRRSGGKKHRAGRNRKHKWKPFYKLSWDEQKKVEERDTRRAQRVRDEMSASGIPLAPYNTTQFLMNDHNIQEPDYEDIQNGLRKRDHSRHFDSSDEYYSFSDDEDYINQQFMEDYETFHESYLEGLPKLELAQQWIGLEDKIEDIEKQLKLLREQKRLLGEGCLDSEAEMAKIEVFRKEIETLAEENYELYKQNMQLHRRLFGHS